MTHLVLTDVKVGMDIYTAHPFYGIDHIVVLGMPYKHKTIDSLFIKCKTIFEGWEHNSSNSLSDMGITEFYNSRRSFKTLKEAEEYVKVSKTDSDVIKSHKRHLEMNEICNELEEEFDNLNY